MAKKNNMAVSGEIDLDDIANIIGKVETNGAVINEIVNKLVAEYCKSLDEDMDFVKTLVEDEDNPPTDRELDDFTLNIPVLLYFTGEAQETLGVKEDIANAVRMELFNEAFDNATGTVADKTAAAGLASQSEYIVHVVYQRAYKKMKLKMEAAGETLNSVKKIITRRISEMDLSRSKQI